MRKRITVSVAGLLALAAAAAFGSGTTLDLRMSPARFWAPGIAAAPRIPMAGDADGDGRADLLVFYPEGDGIIDYIRTSPLGKPCFPTQARTSFGHSGLAAACGRFTGGPGAEVLALFADGSVRVASGMKPHTSAYSRDDRVGEVPIRMMPAPPLLATAAELHADGKSGGKAEGRADVLIVGADGKAVLLQNERSSSLKFTPYPAEGFPAHLRQLAAGDLRGNGRAELVWMDASGAVFRSIVARSSAGIARLTRTTRIVQASPDDRLAVGRFRGGKQADVLVGQRFFPAGRSNEVIVQPDLPMVQEEKGDVAWIAADLTGNGRDDLIRVRRSGARFVGDDVLVHFPILPAPILPGARHAAAVLADAPASSSDDGLLDDWKTGKIRPGCLDLAALGCIVGHRDVIVELQPFQDVPDAPMRAEMAQVVHYYASLPMVNRDGSKGIALHVIYRDAIPMTDKDKGWPELGEKYHPANHRGITHWMVVYHGGGGQSGQMDDRGSCGSNAFYATFLHEFGHQLGLDHTGFWAPNWCPTYPSLMNYAYNYQLNGKRSNIGYSDGRLSSVVLNERHLSERLPLPPDKIAFLAGPPYHYRMKPTPDGKGTLIDWNWNGIFGEEDIAADINYGYSTTAGERHTIGKTYTAPAPVVIGSGAGETMAVFFGQLPENAPRPTPDAAAKRPGLEAGQPGRLLVRIWQGKDPAADGDKWSDEIDVDKAGVTGDPSVASFDKAAWVAYPTTSGVKIRRVALDANPVAGDAFSVPDSAGAEPTLTPFAGALALLLWRSSTTPVGIRMLTVTGSSLDAGPEAPLGFTSTAPVGAAAGAEGKDGFSLWIGLTQDQDKDRPARWQVRRFLMPAVGQPLQQKEQEWIGGEKGGERGQSRIILLREADPAFGPEGQLFFFGHGAYDKTSPWSCHYVCTRIADKTVNGGWLTRRYYDEWTQSRSAPGACFFRGDIFFAARWFGDVHGWDNDNLFVAFFGRGIESEPMGDFDDIGLIRDVGMSHSIPWVKE